MTVRTDAPKDVVVISINNDSADRCVDFLLGADGFYRYKEFRRDAEDQRGWFLTAFDERTLFATCEIAIESALVRVAWLGEAIERGARDR